MAEPELAAPKIEVVAGPEAGEVDVLPNSEPPPGWDDWPAAPPNKLPPLPPA